MPYQSTQPKPVSRELSRAEGLRLLQNVSFGRIVFITRAMPGIRFVGHATEDGDLLVGLPRDSEIARLLTQVSRVVYEADVLDTATRRGWGVVLTGRAGLVESPEEIARARRRLQPWPGEEIHIVVRIHPELVTAFQIDHVGG